jgi:hypothetical protein
MTRRKLPIGIQTFSEIRREDHSYVDQPIHLIGTVRRAVEFSRERRSVLGFEVETLSP